MFPAGQKQARVQLPALMLEVTAKEVLDTPATCEAIDEAVVGGATAVILSEADSGGGTAVAGSTLMESGSGLNEVTLG